MKGRATKSIGTWATKPLILATLISLFIATNCAEIKLGTIPTPPPSPKLRMFVKAISGDLEVGEWKMPHDEFEKRTYRNIRWAFADITTYVVVPEEEVRMIIEEREPMGWQWEKNNWALAVEVSKRLHAEYAMLVVRNWSRAFGLRIKFVLINADTKKKFENVALSSALLNSEERRQTYKEALIKLNNDAMKDLLAMANRKERIASKELAETKKELQELIAGVGEEKTTVKIAKEKKPELKKNQREQDEKVVKVSKEMQPAPQANLSAVDASRDEKVASLEAKLAKLMETLAQLEGMKKQIEEQRKQSDTLVRELAEKEQREKMLLSKLEDSSKNPPVIVLASPGDKSKTEVNFVYLSGVVEDEKGIRRLEIFLNENPLKMGSERGLKVAPKKSPKRLEFKERVPLEKGVNRIKVRAVDSDGLFSDKTLTVHYVKKRKNMWAVIIGIDKYLKVRQLKYAVNDARIFYDHLVKYNQIRAENVILLLDQDATLAKIRSALGTWLKNKAGKDDMVLIYFASHGATERDTYSPDGDGLEKYLLPFDADLKDLYATALPMGELSRIFNRIRSERLIYIADACYSGASGGRTIGITGMRANISEAFIDRIASGKGRVIITASGANEVSVEKDELQHGVFTYFLIEGLKGPADVDKDGLVTVDEAYNYVSEHVPQATDQEQHPVKKGIVEGRLILSIIQ